MKPLATTQTRATGMRRAIFVASDFASHMMKRAKKKPSRPSRIDQSASFRSINQENFEEDVETSVVVLVFVGHNDSTRRAPKVVVEWRI